MSSADRNTWPVAAFEPQPAAHRQVARSPRPRTMVGRAVSSKRTTRPLRPSTTSSPTAAKRTRRGVDRAQHDGRERRRVDCPLDVAEVVGGARPHESADACGRAARAVGQGVAVSRRGSSAAASPSTTSYLAERDPLRGARNAGRATGPTAAAGRPRCPPSRARPAGLLPVVLAGKTLPSAVSKVRPGGAGAGEQGVQRVRRRHGTDGRDDGGEKTGDAGPDTAPSGDVAHRVAS